jgi:two-component system sensor histidine kinase DegS
LGYDLVFSPLTISGRVVKLLVKITNWRSPSTMRGFIHNPHFWIIVIIVLALSFFYQFWPWLECSFLRYYLATPEFRYNLVGSLFIIPLAYSAIIFWWRGAVFFWVLIMAVMLPKILAVSPNLESVISNLAYFLFPLVIVAIVALELNWRQKERRNFTQWQLERQDYISQILRAQENERRRISQELHDDTTQTLLALANRAQTLISDKNKGIQMRDENQTEWIRDTALRLADDMRRLSLSLRPSILDNLGLVAAIRWLSENLNREDNIHSEVSVKGAERKLSPESEIAIFRIVQEALNNVKRHSKAKDAIIILEFNPESLKVTVQDNGLGFTLPRRGSLTSEGKLGLMGIEQRVESIGGTVQVSTKHGEGTSLSVEVKY